MQDSTLSQIIAILKQMPSGTAPPWTKETTAFYAGALAHVPDDVLKASVSKVCSEVHFRPMPAAILDVAKAIMGEKAPSSAAALEKVRKWRYTPGHYGIVDPQRPYMKHPGWNIPPHGHPLEFDPTTITVLNALGGLGEFYEARPEYSGPTFDRMYRSTVTGNDEDIRQCRLDFKANRQERLEQMAKNAVDEDYETQPRVDDHSERVKNLLGDIGKEL